jgi:hypothetical protein
MQDFASGLASIDYVIIGGPTLAILLAGIF